MCMSALRHQLFKNHHKQDSVTEPNLEDSRCSNGSLENVGKEQLPAVHSLSPQQIRSQAKLLDIATQ